MSLFTLGEDGEFCALRARVTVLEAFCRCQQTKSYCTQSILAPAPFMKSVPNRPAASVGSKHTRNWCLNSRLPIMKETGCWPLMSRASPVTPYGFKGVALTSLLDMPGCKIRCWSLCLQSDVWLLLYSQQWRTVLQQDRIEWRHDSIFRGLQAEGAVFAHASLALP